MEISKDKLQKLLAQEKEAREQRERYYEQIIFDYEHKVMELGQEKRKCERLVVVGDRRLNHTQAPVPGATQVTAR